MNPQSRNFAFLLYPDEDPTHNFAMQRLALYDNVCWIVHDKDVDSNGEILKPHTHVVLMLDRLKHLEQLCAELGIASNYCQPIIGRRVEKLRYLIHIDSPQKYQYLVNDVDGSVKGLRNFRQALNITADVNEGEAMLLLLQFVQNNPKCNNAELVLFSVENDIYSVFRRNYSIIKDYKNYLN